MHKNCTKNGRTKGKIQSTKLDKGIICCGNETEFVFDSYCSLKASGVCCVCCWVCPHLSWPRRRWLLTSGPRPYNPATAAIYVQRTPSKLQFIAEVFTFGLFLWYYERPEIVSVSQVLIFGYKAFISYYNYYFELLCYLLNTILYPKDYFKFFSAFLRSLFSTQHNPSFNSDSVCFHYFFNVSILSVVWLGGKTMTNCEDKLHYQERTNVLRRN